MDWSDLLKNLSILIGIWVAISGVNAWRREHSGKRRVELAEDILALFYEAADAIRALRHPFSFPQETEEVEKAEGESEEAYQDRKNASVVFHRYKQHQELFNKLHAMRYRFMAQIGKEEAKPFDAIRKIVNEIIAAARMLARLWARPHFASDQQWREHQQRVDKQEAIFWEGLKEEDPINPRLDQTVQDMEQICRAVIEEQFSLLELLNRPIFKRANKKIQPTAKSGG
jgi:hypothetical protein